MVHLLSSLDGLLHGGVHSDEIIEFLGKSASGKSQLCMRLCASALQHTSTTTVLYVDTAGNFDAKRLKTYLELYPTIHDENDSIESRLSRLRWYLAPTIRELMDVLIQTRTMIAQSKSDYASKREDLKGPTDQFYSQLRLVIIDSLAAPFTPFMGVLPQQAKSQLSIATVELQRLAIQQHCAVVAVNHARGIVPKMTENPMRNFSGAAVAATATTNHVMMIGCLGTSWAQIPHKRLTFERRATHTRGLDVTVKLTKTSPVCDPTVGSCDLTL